MKIIIKLLYTRLQWWLTPRVIPFMYCIVTQICIKFFLVHGMRYVKRIQKLSIYITMFLITYLDFFFSLGSFDVEFLKADDASALQG